MPIEVQHEQERRLRATAVVVIAVCAVPFVLFAAVMACIALALNSLGDIDLNIGDGGHEHHLAAIPVDPKACPYLAPVRADAADLAQLWTAALGGTLPADQFHAAVGSRLPHFEMVLVAARAHVPPPVAQKIDAVVWDVESGRTSVAWSDPMTVAFSAPMSNGLRALADASDLVGSACGEPLYNGFTF